MSERTNLAALTDLANIHPFGIDDDNEMLTRILINQERIMAAMLDWMSMGGADPDLYARVAATLHAPITVWSDGSWTVDGRDE